MNITAIEKLMYRVMKAVYDSGIPMSFKGSMVLKACLLEAGCYDDTRHTVDIDANWNTDTQPTAEQMVGSLQSAIDRSETDLLISMYRMYGEKRSAGFEVKDRTTNETLFTMDIDVNRPIPPTRIYEVDGLRFCGASPTQMIADKISAISTEKVFRRIKDVVDLYYFSKVFVFDKEEVTQAQSNSGRTFGSFYWFLNCAKDLEHAYDKFRFEGEVEKPPFEEVYNTVKAFIKDILPKQ